MPQMAWLFSTAHVGGLKNESFSIARRGKRIDALERARRFDKGRVDGGNTRARIAGKTRSRKRARKTRPIERGTAAQGVPVRQIRVAELDDDVAVRFFEATRRKRNVIGAFVSFETRNEHHAGEDSALCGNPKKFSRGKNSSSLQRAKRTRFLGSRWRSRRLRKKLESSSAHLGNLISDRSEFVSFTGTKTKRSRPFSQAPALRADVSSKARKKSLERETCSAEAGDETGEAKGTRRRERTLLDLQKPVFPPKRSKAS